VRFERPHPEIAVRSDRHKVPNSRGDFGAAKTLDAVSVIAKKPGFCADPQKALAVLCHGEDGGGAETEVFSEVLDGIVRAAGKGRRFYGEGIRRDAKKA
jgi:hypothetical protein